jgi:hypothetical protein
MAEGARAGRPRSALEMILAAVADAAMYAVKNSKR